MEFIQANGTPSIDPPLKSGPSASPFFEQYDSLEVQISQLLSKGRAPFVVVEEQNLRRECPSSECGDIQKRILTYNRKEKSLAELSKKFLNKFEGANSSILALDQVTIDLNVQRRRIYDIINIMESLGVVTKIKKNLYHWKGLARAIQTIQLIKENITPQNKQKYKKEKSLECLAAQFLKLFLTYNPIITLEEAARVILQDANQKMKKTKIRRLYDIVNVFKCLGLVKKIHIETGKSGFEWAGIDKLKKIIQEKRDFQLLASDAEEQNEMKTEKDDEDSCEGVSHDKCSSGNLEAENTQKIRDRRDTTILTDPCSNHCKDEDYFMSEEKKAESLKEGGAVVKNPSQLNENISYLSYFSIVMKAIDKEGEKSIDGLHHELSGILWPI